MNELVVVVVVVLVVLLLPVVLVVAVPEVIGWPVVANLPKNGVPLNGSVGGGKSPQ